MRLAVLSFGWQIGLLFLILQLQRAQHDPAQVIAPSADSSYLGAGIGEVVDAWRGVPVIANGENYLRSHGRHFSEDEYYYGKKWQCVEYAKRFAKDALDHEMPDVMGHAISFFDPAVDHGQLNPARDLIQYQNGSDDLPEPDDLIVWGMDGYGHIAVVTRVDQENQFIEVIQQNIKRASRLRLPIEMSEEGYVIGIGRWAPLGWLRKQATSKTF